MSIIFEFLKWFYFLLSIIVWLFFLRGLYIFSNNIFVLIWKILLPWYLLLTWIILGYIIWTFIITKDNIKEEKEKDKIYIKGLIIWLTIGILLDIIFIFKISI
jgi:hypothetical protein